MLTPSTTVREIRSSKLIPGSIRSPGRRQIRCLHCIHSRRPIQSGNLCSPKRASQRQWLLLTIPHRHMRQKQMLSNIPNTVFKCSYQLYLHVTCTIFEANSTPVRLLNHTLVLSSRHRKWQPHLIFEVKLLLMMFCE